MTPKQIENAIMQEIQMPKDDNYKYMSFSYRHLVRYVLDWLVKNKIIKDTK